MEIIEKVNRKKEPLTSNTKVDSFTDIATKAFDYEFDGEVKFYPFEKPKNIPKKFSIGLIVGSSGSGKSTLLNEFGVEEIIDWESDKAIISHFNNPDEAVNRLSSVGLNSIPSWVKPYQVLSTGEKFRANLSRKIKSGAVIDEFTSVVDRTVAKATSVAIKKFIIKEGINNVVFCSCHNDIIEWLEPDWVFDSNEGILYDGRSLRRPKIETKIFSIEKDIWRMFSQYHYLDAKLNKASRCFGILWNEEIVGFTAVLPMPSGTVKHAWRGHRTVILPDYQGMGIGSRVSDVIGEMLLKEGKKYYSRSAHPRFGSHRNNSSNWIQTSKNQKLRTDIGNQANQSYDQERICYSHEYVGKDFTKKESFKLLFMFDKDYEIDYNYFKSKVDSLLINIKDTKNVIFVSGKPKQEYTYAEKMCIERGIRQECYPTVSKFKKIKNHCDAVVLIGNTHEDLKFLEGKNIPIRFIK